MGGKYRCARQVFESKVAKEARQEAVWEGIEMGGKSRCARQVLQSKVAKETLQKAVLENIEMSSCCGISGLRVEWGAIKRDNMNRGGMRRCHGVHFERVHGVAGCILEGQGGEMSPW